MHQTEDRIRLAFISSINVRWHHLELLARHIDRRRFDVSFLLLSLAEHPPHIEGVLREEGIPYERVDCKVSPRGIWTALKAVYRHCRQRRVQVVHTHIFFASLVGLLGSFLARVPSRINTRHHATMNHGTSFRHLDRMNNRLATRTVVTSDLLHRVVEDMEGVPADKVDLVRLGIDLDPFLRSDPEKIEALREKYVTPGAVPVVGVIARHIEQKGIQFVIPAFKRLLETHPDAFLVLAYAVGPYRSTLEEMLEDVPDERYRLLEFEEDVASLYGVFDVLVHAPTGADQESFGLIYLEALAAGVPSIFTLAGVAPEILRHRHNAWVVDFGDADAIYEGLRAVLGNPALAEELVANGRRTVDPDFRHETMVRGLEAIYVDDLSRRDHRASRPMTRPATE